MKLIGISTSNYARVEIWLGVSLSTSAESELTRFSNSHTIKSPASRTKIIALRCRCFSRGSVEGGKGQAPPGKGQGGEKDGERGVWGCSSLISPDL
jgi:hypothetical protein